MTSEDGFSLIEWLVAMSAGVIVALGAFTLVDAAGRQSNKQVTRVDANQRARPVLQNLMDDLHNTCIGPNVVPVSPGSTDSSLAFTMPTPATLNGVTPTAEEHVVSLSSGVLTETTYPATNTTAPWTFSATPNGPAPGPPPGPRMLMTGVGQAAIGGTTVPVFQYFAYNGGADLNHAAADTAQRHQCGPHCAGHGRVLGLTEPDHGAGSQQRHTDHRHRDPPPLAGRGGSLEGESAMVVRARDEEGGFAMILAVLAVALILSWRAAALTATGSDLHLTQHDFDHKRAYEAAQAGIADYAFHLNADNNYWTRCTYAPTPNAVNQQRSTSNRRTVAGSTGRATPYS